MYAYVGICRRMFSYILRYTYWAPYAWSLMADVCTREIGDNMYMYQYKCI
jgi:hypothetical protein